MKKRLSFALAALGAAFLFAACGGEAFENPGDRLNGGSPADYLPDITFTALENRAERVVSPLSSPEAVPAEAIPYEGGAIEEGGDYLITGNFAKKVEVKAEGVRLFFENAGVNLNGEAISSEYGLTMVFLGNYNSISATAQEGSDAIVCRGTLRICGGGACSISSTGDCIGADSVEIADTQLNIAGGKDGIRAEISKYDDYTNAPQFGFSDGGYVSVDSAKLTVRTEGDCIRADTFVLISGEGEYDLTAGGGAPEKISKNDSDSGRGKAIEVGPIDWGKDGMELESGDYFAGIFGGNFRISSRDDAICSDGEISIRGGAFEVASGGLAIHAERLLKFGGGNFGVIRSFGGVEAAKAEISGGKLSVEAAGDGIFATDGTQNLPGKENRNCHIIVSGGEVTVSAEKSAMKSVGSVLFSGGAAYLNGASGSSEGALVAAGSVVADGGSLFAAGGLGMVQTPASNSRQFAVSFASRSEIKENTVLALWDESGTELLSFTSQKVFRSAVFSCSALAAGNAYRLFGGNEELCSFRILERITYVGSGAVAPAPGAQGIRR